MSEMAGEVVILGNGVAGFSAALRLRSLRPDLRITMVSGESKYPYSRPALMYMFLGHMRYRDAKPFEDGLWDEQRIELVRDWVEGIDTDQRRLKLASGETLRYDQLLLATGSKPARYGWPGQDLQGVQGLYGLADLKRLEEMVQRARRAAIVGGGLIGIELAEMLHARGVEVTFLVRERSYWDNVLPDEESALVNRLIRRAGLDLRLETQLREIVDDGQGRCCAVVTAGGERIPCEIVGLTAGVTPNVELAKAAGIPVARGILVDGTLRSQMDGVWAAGDCAEIRFEGAQSSLLQQVWYTGRMQGQVAAEGLAGRPRIYDPGIWFNSAKFLDLEYQTYGLVHRKVPGERSLYWERPDGMACLRIVYTTQGVIGFNALGLRLRHDVCESWIRGRASPERVLSELHAADFGPEFSRRHAREVLHAFRRQLAQAS